MSGAVAYDYRFKPVLHPTERDQYAEPAKLEIEPQQASIVREMFELPDDRAGAERHSGPSPGSDVETKSPPLRWLDGLCRPHHPEDPSLHGDGPSERLAVRARPHDCL